MFYHLTPTQSDNKTDGEDDIHEDIGIIATNTRRRLKTTNIYLRLSYDPIWSSYKSMSNMNYYFWMDNIFKSLQCFKHQIKIFTLA